ncbi:hypothetical protein PRIPAC_90129 [Pristionchus pacificus]|uniref:Uncharacterized protein n=1 Tax=Pristionchus pacificus TaxID=54126 RepID=A0A2A6B7G2_PRIPA|nr:hypothetical protein PRIPAC_90129 [Pristionchus pacificus]|eukprot:PDM61793.1 hypothetical protein PRIPAC_51235 [Pristionchus pacificus]
MIDGHVRQMIIVVVAVEGSEQGGREERSGLEYWFVEALDLSGCSNDGRSHLEMRLLLLHAHATRQPTADSMNSKRSGKKEARASPLLSLPLPALSTPSRLAHAAPMKSLFSLSNSVYTQYLKRMTYPNKTERSLSRCPANIVLPYPPTHHRTITVPSVAQPISAKIAIATCGGFEFGKITPGAGKVEQFGQEEGEVLDDDDRKGNA